MPRKPKDKGLGQSCTATLIINGKPYAGSTGNDRGHAEMHALSRYIDATLDKIADKNGYRTLKQGIPDIVAKLRTAHPRTVICTSRPVCLQCGTVLKKLGFSVGRGTTWGTKTMGSTEWGVGLNAREVLAQFGINYATIVNLRR